MHAPDRQRLGQQPVKLSSCTSVFESTFVAVFESLVVVVVGFFLFLSLVVYWFVFRGAAGASTDRGSWRTEGTMAKLNSMKGFLETVSKKRKLKDYEQATLYVIGKVGVAKRLIYLFM